MRTASIANAAALRERLMAPYQVDVSVAESAMPPYMESFLAHLRLLIGVPFDYLVPDSRLLPNESIRFFYVDRSWTDRLVDGALAVGKIGTREQAQHQAHSQNIQSQLDLTERMVRVLQRGITDIPPPGSGGIITGFLLRSAAVSGWPSMDVRAFSVELATPATQQVLADARAFQLRTLRLELLSPSVLLALFDGIPKLVWCEEPHHAIQFGMTLKNGAYYLDRHDKTGATEQGKQMVRVPVRAADNRVVAVKALRQRLFALQATDTDLVPQTGSAALAIELLNLPWRQRFQGTKGTGGTTGGGFVSSFSVTSAAVRTDLAAALQGVL